MALTVNSYCLLQDHAETRRGKPSVNRRWDITRSAMCGDYILAVAAKVLAQIRNEDVLIVLAQVLADLVRGDTCFLYIPPYLSIKSITLLEQQNLEGKKC
jgi:Polyprenyl synthetase